MESRKYVHVALNRVLYVVCLQADQTHRMSAWGEGGETVYQSPTNTEGDDDHRHWLWGKGEVETVILITKETLVNVSQECEMSVCKLSVMYFTLFFIYYQIDPSPHLYREFWKEQWKCLSCNIFVEFDNSRINKFPYLPLCHHLFS